MSLFIYLIENWTTPKDVFPSRTGIFYPEALMRRWRKSVASVQTAQRTAPARNPVPE